MNLCYKYKSQHTDSTIRPSYPSKVHPNNLDSSTTIRDVRSH